jgi:hypothetical protein
VWVSADHGDQTEQVFASLQELRLADTDEFITHDDIPLWHHRRNGDTSSVYSATGDFNHDTHDSAGDASAMLSISASCPRSSRA